MEGNMDFETYKRKLLEENERNRLSELQTKYNGVETPDYENMSLRDELQTRFDLDELNNLQQKYGVQQTPASQPQVTASVSQPSYGQQTSFQQPNSQSSTWDNTLRKLKDGATIAWDTIKYTPSSLAEIGMAISDLNRNYWDMKKDNTINNDDYFHCKANYEAASRGTIGAKTAEILGDAKENYWDYWDNQYRKGLTKSEADIDKSHDKQVNKIGRQRAQSGLYSNSQDACNSYRVNGINDKY